MQTKTVVAEVLTEQQRRDFDSFLSSIKAGNYLKPVALQGCNNRIFYGATLGEASKLAKAGMEKAGGKSLKAAAEAAVCVEVKAQGKTDIIKGLVETARSTAGEAAWEKAGRSMADLINVVSAIDNLKANVALKAKLIALDDFKGKDAFVKFTTDIVDAWLSGYCVAGERDGVLYLYAVANPTSGINRRQ